MYLSRGSYRVVIKFHQKLPEHEHNDDSSGGSDGSEVIHSGVETEKIHQRPEDRSGKHLVFRHENREHSRSRHED